MTIFTNKVFLFFRNNEVNLDLATKRNNNYIFLKVMVIKTKKQKI